MKIFLKFFLFVLFYSEQSFAKNHMLILGGGGEDPGPKTIFDDGMKTLARNPATRYWDQNILFNGGHSESEALLRSHYSKANVAKEFTAANYFNLFDDYKKRMLNGKIAPNDQVIIIISSHSTRQGKNQVTHNIMAKNKTIESYGKLQRKPSQISLDQLKELTDIAKNKNIKIGIVDLGCFSGNTLNLDAPNACIISAAGKDNFSQHGRKSFPNKFFDSIKSGRTMEETFLRARVSSSDSSYPMINTPEGRKLSAEFYNLLSNYMKSNDDHYKLLGDVLIKTANDQSLYCKREDQFKELLNKVDQFSKFSYFMNFQGLKNKLIAYKKHQDEIIKKIKDQTSILHDNREVINMIKTPNQIIPYTYSWAEILSTDTEIILREIEKRNEPSESGVADFYKKVEEKKIELKTKYPDLENKVSKAYALADEVSSTYEMAKEVMEEEKILFNRFYQKDKSNPCSEMKF